jgi:hypothetical protein
MSRKKFHINLVTREDIKNKLTLKKYMELPKGSEIIIFGPAPHEFLKDNIIYNVASEKFYSLKKINPHPLREFFRK